MVDWERYIMFENLLYQLHNMPFYSLIPNDDNRGMDGLQLRNLYEEAEGYIVDFDDDVPCTLLEMLIALAERMAYIIYDSENEEEYNTASCFWLFIRNLNLTPESGTNISKLNDLLERRYAENGDGGLFPLRRPITNQREIEIWYQMMYYIEEEYS